MAYTTINKSGDYFNTKLYTGTGSSNAITGVGFQPDWTWIKCRDDTHNHQVFDAVRGVYKRLRTDTNGAETESNESLKSFNSDGFTLGTQTNVNQNSSTFASWNWKAGTTSGIAAGSQTITPTGYSINTTSGFGIYAYEGSGGVSNQTISHGLGKKPSLILIKRVNSDKDWTMYHNSLGATKYMELNVTNSVATSNTVWADTEPTSSLFTIGTNSQVNANPGDTYIAYAFAEKTGYSKFGSYTGNGNADGTFVYTGFKPAFYMVKRTDDTGAWIMKDNKRPGYNLNGSYLLANDSQTEATGSGNVASDELSNGFKIRGTSSSLNTSGATYIYMAFAEAPLVGSNNVPANAR